MFFLPNRLSDLFALETIFSSFVELPAPESVELLESLGDEVNSWSFTWNFTTCAWVGNNHSRWLPTRIYNFEWSRKT